LEELEFGEDDEREVIYADSLCKPKNILEMPELLLVFHASVKL